MSLSDASRLKSLVSRVWSWALLVCLLVAQATPVLASMGQIDRAGQLACCAKGMHAGAMAKGHACCKRTKHTGPDVPLFTNRCHDCVAHWEAPSTTANAVLTPGLPFVAVADERLVAIPSFVFVGARQARALDSRPPPSQA